MLDVIELWQVPILVAGVILLSYGAYVFTAKRSSRLTALRIRFSGAVVLVLVALFLSYQLVERAELSVVVGVATLGLDIFVAWVTMQELRELRTAKSEIERTAQPAEAKDEVGVE